MITNIIKAYTIETSKFSYIRGSYKSTKVINFKTETVVLWWMHEFCPLLVLMILYRTIDKGKDFWDVVHSDMAEWEQTDAGDLILNRVYIAARCSTNVPSSFLPSGIFAPRFFWIWVCISENLVRAAHPNCMQVLDFSRLGYQEVDIFVPVVFI